MVGGAFGGHRRAIVLAGARDWGRDTLRRWLSPEWAADTVRVSDEPGDEGLCIPPGKVHARLGQESAAVVFDAWSGFDPDAFGAVVGTIRGGGLLLLLTPPLADWPDFPDPVNARISVYPTPPQAVTGRFLKRLAGVLVSDPAVTVIEQGQALPSLPDFPALPAMSTLKDQGAGEDSVLQACRTLDQRAAVEAVLRVAKGHRRRPAVLVSDRGRGKSAALGLAAAALIRTGVKQIVVTAPHADAVQALLENAGRQLPGAQVSKTGLGHGDARIDFIAPDKLVREESAAGLLLVDEAAAIPAPILETLLTRHARVAFATTVHGYEGTGRGFDLRFREVLNERTPHWKTVRLQAPVRWAADDPVERLVFRALLLDAEPEEDTRVAGAEPATCEIRWLDRDDLVDDQDLLGRLFGLLVIAHYRTRPFDLRHLLDGPNLRVAVMSCGEAVVATALVAREGGLEADVAREIWRGDRRPHGHLLPETLAAHLGLVGAPELRGDRVMRIAVHPAGRRRGLGSRLLEAVVRQSRDDGLDYVGAVYGSSPALLSFWSRAGFEPVRVSLKRGATSGAHSVVELCPLNDAGDGLLMRARAGFHDAFPLQLADPLRDMEPGLALALLRQAHDGTVSAPDQQDWQDLLAFAWGRRLYETCMGPVWRLVRNALSSARTGQCLDEAARELLLMKVMQKRDWQALAEQTGLPGRAGVVQALRDAVGLLVLEYGDETIRQEARRMRDH